MDQVSRALLAVGGGSADYQISRSLRFNSADSAYLNRTPASAGNRRTFTISFWMKRGALGTIQYLFGAGSGTTESTWFAVALDTFTAVDQIGSGSWTTTGGYTNASLRDPSAWYHIVLAIDTTQATAANRSTLYINGVLQTYAGAVALSLNADLAWNNSGVVHYIGARIDAGPRMFFDGYITEINSIDGQALTPSSFGETNAQTGVWQPKAYSGSYGTNGFYLNFSDNSNTTAATLGKDYSGNGNNWTPNNFSVASGAGNDSLVDTPTPYGVDTGAGGNVRGNYCTLNPLNAKLGAGSLANGNLAFTGPSGESNYNFIGGTIAITTDTTTGFYFELTQSTYGIYGGVSLLDTGFSASRLDTLYALGSSEGGGVNATAGITYRNDGRLYNYGTNTSGLTTWSSSGDVIGVAIKDNKVWFAKNGTWISGDPAAGTSPSITLASTKTVTPAGQGINSCVFDYNFGQRPFAYTAPSGYKALCTQNLPTPTIGATTATQAGNYFTPTAYTGNGSSSRAITNGINMSANGGLVWTKQRSGVEWHFLIDNVRGNTKYLSSNATNAEGTISTLVTSFDSTGYSIGNDSGINSNGSTYVSWVWGAGGAGSSNTAGSITSTVSANTTSGFSVVTCSPSGSAFTVGHGLGAAPKFIIAKLYQSTADWNCYHESLGKDKYIVLNSTSAALTSTTLWQNTAPTSTVLSFAAVSSPMLFYCFAEVPGFSKFGSYTGNGSSDGPFVYCGFRPAYVMVKASSSVANGYWVIKDKLRAANYNPQNGNLYANASFAEDTVSTVNIDFLSNGFKIRGTYDGVNGNSATYVFAAFAEAPQKFALAR